MILQENANVNLAGMMIVQMNYANSATKLGIYLLKTWLYSQTCIGETNKNCTLCNAGLFSVLDNDPIGECKCDKGYY